MTCSFCGKGQAEVARLIAGKNGSICNGCVLSCLEALDEARPETPFLDRASDGRVVAVPKERVVVHLPNGNAYACVQVTRWEPLDGGAFEWCCAEGPPSKAAIVIVCVRRIGERSAVGETYASDTKPGREQARTIAARVPDGENEVPPPLMDVRPTECWIADEPVAFLHVDGRREVGRIAIGLPVVVNEREARCRIALDGFERSVSIFGASPLQALVVATLFLARRLHWFRTHGGRVVERDGDDDVSLDSIFGPLLTN